MKVERRFPNFVDPDPRERIPVEVADFRDLCNLDWIQRIWLSHPRFVRFTYTKYEENVELLKVITSDGGVWVVAYGREGSFKDFGIGEYVE